MFVKIKQQLFANEPKGAPQQAVWGTFLRVCLHPCLWGWIFKPCPHLTLQ